MARSAVSRILPSRSSLNPNRAFTRWNPLCTTRSENDMQDRVTDEIRAACWSTVFPWASPGAVVLDSRRVVNNTPNSGTKAIVPEPGTVMLLATGMIGLGVAGRRARAGPG